MSENSTTVIQDGQLAVATVAVTGELITGASTVDTTAIVQTEQGKQLAVKAFVLNGGGGGDYIPTSQKGAANGVATLDANTLIPASQIPVDNDTITVENGKIKANSSGGSYVLPPATGETLGGVKIGPGLSVTEDGTVSATGGGGGANTSLSNLTDAGKIQAAHLAMPSGTVYDNLTLPATGSTVVAPADGYFTLYSVTAIVGDANPYVALFNSATGLFSSDTLSHPRVLGIGCNLAAKKGDSVVVRYDALNMSFSSDPGYFRFVYAVGSESEQGV